MRQNNYVGSTCSAATAATPTRIVAILKTWDSNTQYKQYFITHYCIR